MPKMYVALELDDAAAFARGLHGLATYLGDVAEDLVVIREKPYRKQPFVSFMSGKDMLELTAGTTVSGVASKTPAFVSLGVSVGVLEDRAILSLSSMSVKREIKRLLKSEESGGHLVVTMEEELPKGVQSYGSTDWGAIFAGIYESARAFLPLIQQGAGFSLPFSIDEMPSADLLPRYIKRSVTWTRAVEGGRLRHQESSLGPEIPALVGLGMGAGLLVGRIEESRSASEERGGDAAQATRQTLEQMKRAIQAHKTEQGTYPERLDELLRASEAFPEGLLDSESVPKDAWGRAFHYERDEDGASYRLWSSGPDGVDAQGEGDDLILAHQS